MRRSLPIAALVSLALGSPGLALAQGNSAPVVDAITVSPSPVPESSLATISCSGHDPDGTIVAVRVIVSAGTLPNGTNTERPAITGGPSVTASIAWSTPIAGAYTVQCGVQDSGGMFGGALITWLTVPIDVVAPVGGPPVLDSFTTTADEGLQGSLVRVSAHATDPDGDPLTYSWDLSAGTLAPLGSDADWTLPYVLGPATVTVHVSDSTGQTVSATRTVEVRWALPGPAMGAGTPLVPERMAVDPLGTLYVTSPREQAVVVFTPLGARLRALPVAGRPGGVAVGAGGTLYVADLDAGRVDRLDDLGRVVGSLGIGAGEFQGPAELAVDPVSGTVYVADGPAGLVKLYAAGGAALGSIALGGAFPSGLAVSPGGAELYVADQAGGRVLVFDSTGLLRRTIGSYGSGPGQLTRPGGLALGPDGNLYVVDVFQGQVVVFSLVGAFVATVGQYGEGAVPGTLQVPLDAVADPFGRLVVTSTGGGRLELFGLPGTVPVTCAGDADCDGMPDAWELAHGFDPNNPADAWLDADGDGLANVLELAHGTDPLRADTDGDGSTDLQELLDGTDPLSARDLGLRASAGPDQTTGPTRVFLDGSGSRYRGGPAPAFAWRQLAGPELLLLAQANTASPSFVARTPGSYRLQLQVSAAGRRGPTDELLVVVEDRPPVADAGPDRGGIPEQRVSLDGRFSTDANEQPLGHRWTQLEGPRVVLSGASSATPSFVPARTGVHTFSLEVFTPGAKGASEDRVHVTIDAPLDHVPVAQTASLVIGAPGEWISLDGRGSVDTDGDPLGYEWRQTAGAKAALIDETLAVARFAADAPGSYELELVVADRAHRSVPQRVVVTVHDAATAVPLADAGPDARRELLAEVPLSCAASVPGEAGAPVCTFRQLEGPEVVLRAAVDGARFVPLRSGSYTFELEVADEGGPGTRDQVTVLVDDPAGNRLPVARYRAPGQARVGAAVLLDGRGSWDPDPHTRLGWSWTQILGPRSILGDDRAPTVSFSPALPGFYAFELRVDDGVDRSPPARVEVVVLP